MKRCRMSRRARSRRPGRTRRRPHATPDLRRLRRMPRLSHGGLRPLEEDPDGERRPRSEGASRRHHSGSEQARSAGDVHEGPDRVRLRQQVEAALLHEESATTIFRSARSGTSRTSSGAPIRCANGTDWWTPFYPGGQQHAADRPAVRRLPLRQLRHPDEDSRPSGTSAARNATARAASTSRNPSRANIVNPARLDSVHANDVCIQCHSQGQPLENPIEGKYYDWPVGYRAGSEAEGFLAARRAQARARRRSRISPTARRTRTGCRGTTSSQSVMYTRGVTCFSCHDVHGTANNADLLKPAAACCASSATVRNRRTARTRRRIEQHTHHKAGSPAANASAATCRRSSRRIADVNVRSHTFKFISPATTDSLKVPNPCTTCHTDKTTKWALGRAQIVAGVLALARRQLNSFSRASWLRSRALFGIAATGIAIAAAVGIGEVALRVTDGYSLTSLALVGKTQPRVVRAPQVEQIALNAARALDLAPGVDAGWFAQDPPPTPTFEMPAWARDRAARYPADAYSPMFEFNRAFLRDRLCRSAPTEVFGNLEDFLYFTPPDDTDIYPSYRHPRRFSAPGWFTTNGFGWRGTGTRAEQAAERCPDCIRR